MEKMIGTLRQLLGALCRIQDSAWQRQQPIWKPSAKAIATWNRLIGFLPPIQEIEINSQFGISKESQVSRPDNQDPRVSTKSLSENPDFG